MREESTQFIHMHVHYMYLSFYLYLILFSLLVLYEVISYFNLLSASRPLLLLPPINFQTLGWSNNFWLLFCRYYSNIYERNNINKI